MLVTATHVDDVLAAGTREWLDWARNKIEERFDKLKVESLPFTYSGMQYSRLPNGTILIQQNEHLMKVQEVALPLKSSDDDDLIPTDLSAFRGLLTTMLYDCQCHPELLT